LFIQLIFSNFDKKFKSSILMITKTIQIEDLVEDYPFAVLFLKDNGIRCIMCGEPIWGTLEEACKEKGFSDKKIEEIINELNKLANKY